MSNVKRILCLAKSRKWSGYCVAGRVVQQHGGRVTPGPWIRPVSARPNREISPDECQYPNGEAPRVLDVIDVPLLKHCPDGCHTEDWLLDSDRCWGNVRRVGWAELQRYVEEPGILWRNTTSSDQGLNDNVYARTANKLKNSLLLIYVPALQIQVISTWYSPKPRVRAHFSYHGVEYNLAVTDPVIEEKYMDMEFGTYNLGESCLTISLGEPLGLYRYKLVAAVIQRKGIKP